MNKVYKFLQDPDFLQIKNTLDGLMKDCTKEDLGNQLKQAEVIIVAEEKEMWQLVFAAKIRQHNC